MTNKAKTYLKNIQEADTEKKLIGIEIAFKQDMTLGCNDLGSLCRAAEDKAELSTAATRSWHGWPASCRL